MAESSTSSLANSSFSSGISESLNAGLSSGISDSLDAGISSSSLASSWRQPVSSEQLIAEAYAAIASKGVHGQPSAPTGTPVSVETPVRDASKRQSQTRQQSRNEAAASASALPAIEARQLPSNRETRVSTRTQPTPPTGQPVSSQPVSSRVASSRIASSRPASSQPSSFNSQAQVNSPPVTPIPVTPLDSPTRSHIPPSRQTLTTGPSADTATVPGAEGIPVFQQQTPLQAPQQIQQRQGQDQQQPQRPQLFPTRMSRMGYWIFWIILMLFFFNQFFLRNLT